MAEANKFIDERSGDIFVGVQGGHASPGTSQGGDLAFHRCRGRHVTLATPRIASWASAADRMLP